MGKRRQARELALEALYRFEIASDGADSILEDIFSRGCEEDVRSYTERLVRETISHLKEIDEIISGVVEHWAFSRIAVLDKNILRFAICELLYFEDVPPRVTIDEAIEIAKKYSTPDSGRFVNGVLDKVAKEKGTRITRKPT